MLPPLPVDETIPDLLGALEKHTAAVLVAPPGAGKTTRVPLALIDQSWLGGRKIIMLEPRRLAARSAATHTASLIGEVPGQTVGYRIRLDTKVGPKTRIEIVTDGVFVRMIMDDPELSGIGAVLFDEFHERSLDSDFALALCLETREALRPDLRLLAMSATMDGAKVASLLGQSGEVPVIESAGRSYPVEIVYQPRPAEQRIEETMAATVRSALRSRVGSILCFLPGQAEIQRTAERLAGLEPSIEICRLYGAMDQESQFRAIRPPDAGRRKIVLATSIAETSITIDGIGVVIDSGLARVPKYEPSTGLTRLVTQKASRASVNQRAGRAGRTSAGTAIRLWHEGQTNALSDYERPEILEADLTGLVLDLAQWGVRDPASMKWLDHPPAQSWKEAVELLMLLGALDAGGGITETGRTLRNLPLPPRLAHMVCRAAGVSTSARTTDAAFLALLLGERGLGGTGIDMAGRLEKALHEKSERASRLHQLAGSMTKSLSAQQIGETLSPGVLLSFAWPERTAANMGPHEGGDILFRLANGRRARLDGLSPLSRQKFLVICDLQGSAASSRIFSAAAISLDEIIAFHGASLVNDRKLEFDPGAGRFKARQTRSLGTLELSSAYLPLEPSDNIAARLVSQLKTDGLAALDLSPVVKSFQDRACFLHQMMPETWPDFANSALEADLENWLLPMVPGIRAYSDISDRMILEGFALKLGHENASRFSNLAPTRFELPSGSGHSLHYEAGRIILRARVQEFFGMKTHPKVINGKIPLTLEFLSPAMRPIQTTQDIAGFWQGSWVDVQRELRGRYPKHFWPDDPANALATTRTKARMDKS